MGSEFTSQLPVEGAGSSRNQLPPVTKANFMAGEYGGVTLRIYGAAVGPRSRTSRVQSPILEPLVKL
jgi:hypothetical protein